MKSVKIRSPIGRLVVPVEFDDRLSGLRLVEYDGREMMLNPGFLLVACTYPAVHLWQSKRHRSLGRIWHPRHGLLRTLRVIILLARDRVDR
jgi:hypothetical protein